MGCCHANSQPFPIELEEHEKLKDVNLKKEPNGKNLIMIEHFAYYEKNPQKNGKYMIKKREIHKTVPILRSVSESKLILRRKTSDSNKAPETSDNTSRKSNEDEKATICEVRADSMELIQ